MATVGTLATLVGGRVIGDCDRQIRDVADLENAGPRHLSFLANPKYRVAFMATRAGAVLVSEGTTEGPPNVSLIVCADPYLALARVLGEFYPPTSWPHGSEPGAYVDPKAQVDPTATVRATAVIEAGAKIGPRTIVSPGAYVGVDAQIGADVLLHPGVKVLARCVLGDRVILQAGVVVGSDGFGYAHDAEQRRYKIPQVGIVEIENDVEIGANTTIDRSTFGVTRIGAGTKIDNLVQIAHNVVTGHDCVIVAQSGIAGSTTLGHRVVMGAQTGVVGHIKICDDVTLAARAGVPNSIRKPGIYSGTPSKPHRDWLRVVASQQALPEMRRRLRELEQQVETIGRQDGK
ncbi:MAG: UDP-3-O-(3-hydroxymyristoyl)glucosamine N-acyltransferase [Deltaproteobacteria bacterium RIFOXYA12_FULL_58_15]|nr:MAG: UDP-3-O-(3-hydroxymyristoyl)glucosamine N-acyltransferase [Deltaproteobacteria bacterium RIFOXYA12_FULL_58_15]OGR09127.1 MAG: UDP-3-O-(3-hydroxymyristoyl)glucosamine N-acyltransferase [Deltaproteobacteria bacterium RIFOXYB12_FULL_58_9]